MAIRRCPYCKAIIDESDKYCNNCGTQLLFPEDEYVEEDIPGDKIIDEEEGEEEEELEEEEEELREEEGEEEGNEEELGEEEFLEESEEEEIELKEEEEQAEEVEEEELEERREEDIDKKYEVALEDDELIFKTKELGKLTPQLKEEGEGLEEEEPEREGEEAEFGELGAREEKKEKSRKETATGSEFHETSQELPPWAREMKERQLSSLEEEEGVEKRGEVGETEEPGEPQEREREKSEEAQDEARTYTEPIEAPTPSSGWTKDSGIGVPESLTQSGLLFGDTGTVHKETASELGLREAAPVSEARKRVKSKLVDVIFITAIWLISLWFAALVTEVSFFRMLTKSPLPILGFYFILLLLYFFLFLYFLGETLGDHYFSGED